jgi:lipopolysaccharide/colanic/teichoic acid biosynthesis glycosyltransferase
MKTDQAIAFIGVYKKKPVYDAVKRIMDVVCSALAIVALFPLMVLISLIIVVDDFGNPFFTQKRVGKDGIEFWMLKFRSMHKDADKKREDLLEYNEADGPLFKLRNDPRVTPFGKFIRRYSLDELPQLFNVLVGSMAIVGPRPFVPLEQEKFNAYQRQRLLVKQGLSCYWQISGRSDSSFDELIESDLRYIQERGLLTDIKIIIKTIFVVLKSKGAY